MTEDQRPSWLADRWRHRREDLFHHELDGLMASVRWASVSELRLVDFVGTHLAPGVARIGWKRFYLLRTAILLERQAALMRQIAELLDPLDVEP